MTCSDIIKDTKNKAQDRYKNRLNAITLYSYILSQ